MYRAFDAELFTGCCTCQLCGISNCPLGTGGCMILNRRPYEVCRECFADESIWRDETGAARQLPKRPRSRAGQSTPDSWVRATKETDA